MEKVLKHDRFVNSLCSVLESDYDVLFTHVPLYSKRNRLVGEIDVLALKNGYCDVYEVKCSPRVHKAKKQLRKLKKVMSLESKLRKAFFFCGQTGCLMSLDSRNDSFDKEDLSDWHSTGRA